MAENRDRVRGFLPRAEKRTPRDPLDTDGKGQPQIEETESEECLNDGERLPETSKSSSVEVRNSKQNPAKGRTGRRSFLPESSRIHTERSILIA
jgi:hypothetical protein